MTAFPPFLVLNKDTGEPQPGAAGLVYDPADTGRVNPLEVTDANGLAIPGNVITANRFGVVDGIYTMRDDLVEIVWVSGQWAFHIDSLTGLKNIVTVAQEQATTAAASAAGAAESAAQSAAAAVAALDAAGVTPRPEVDADAHIADLVGDRATATGTALDGRYPAAVVLAGEGIDPTGATDSTTAVQALFTSAGALGVGRVHVPAGTYDIDSVSLTSSITVTCDPGVTLRRAAGADFASGSYWAIGAAMFEVDAPGLTVEFSGFTYDGNGPNQTTTDPTGFFLKTYPTATVTADPTTVRIDRARFTKGTSGYLLLRGDDSQRRYQTRVHLDRCEFTDTVYGKGAGDPSSPTPLGYHPTYVHVYDYVTVNTRDFTATWDKPTGLGQYAATAVRATFYGQDSTLSGEASVLMHGTTYLRGVGRSGKSFDNEDAYGVNNGIGAIDMYGNAEELYVEHVVAVDCENVPVRAKASLAQFAVGSAVLRNCHRGLQVGPSSTGTNETVVSIGSVVSYGGAIPQVEVTGNTTTNRVPFVTLGSVDVRGPLTNPEALVGIGGVHLRNIVRLSTGAVEVRGAPGRGITVTDVESADLAGVVIDGTVEEGIACIGGLNLAITGFDVQNTGGYAISSSGNPPRLTVAHGRVRGAVDYGVFSNNSTTHLTVEDVTVEAVSGGSYGFYTAGGDSLFVRNKTLAGVTNPLRLGASAAPRQRDNSWNPTESWGIGAPTAGTYVRGSKVWLTNPVAGGNAGWICTADGTPGTWNTFGAITA